jgi:hypothetical protein
MTAFTALGSKPGSSTRFSLPLFQAALDHHAIGFTPSRPNAAMLLQALARRAIGVAALAARRSLKAGH